MKSRTRKLAWLLSAAMVFTTVNPGMTVVASEENEVVEQTTEEAAEQEEEITDSEETEETELTENAENPEDDIVVEASSPEEAGEDEEQLLMVEEEKAEDDSQAVAVYADEENEITEITDIQGMRTIFVQKEEDLSLVGATISVKYANGKTDTLTFDKADVYENYYASDGENTVWARFYDENGKLAEDSRPDAGTYTLHFEVNGKEVASPKKKVLYTRNTDDFSFAHAMTLGDNAVETTRNSALANWYYFEAPEDGRYHIDDGGQAIMDIYIKKDNQLNYYDGAMKLGDDCFVAKKGDVFYFAFREEFNYDDVHYGDAEPIYKQNVEIAVIKDVESLAITPVPKTFYEHVEENHVFAALNITYTSGIQETEEVKIIDEIDGVKWMYDKYGNGYKIYLQKDGNSEWYSPECMLDAGTYTVHIQWAEDTSIETTYEITVLKWPTPFTDPSIEVMPMDMGKDYTVELNNGVVDKWFKYTPQKNMNIVFESSRLSKEWIDDYRYDTYGEIYDESGKMIASDDQGGEGNQFKAECELSAGKTYYFRARMHDMKNDGKFSVSLKEKEHTHTYIEERKEATCTQEGYTQQKCSFCGDVKEGSYTVLPTLAHSFGAYSITTRPTAVAAGVQTRICSVCGYSESAEVAKLKANVTLSATSLPLQVKQSASLSKLIKSMTTGDKLVSCSSSNKKVATVSKVGKVTGKEAGTAKITMKFASGLSKTVTVKVQKAKVAATKISNLPVSVTLKVKKTYRLSPVITPMTTKEKATYKTANKKIATVSKNGTITAKKAGKTTITVQVGKKTKKVKVTVKKK